MLAAIGKVAIRQGQLDYVLKMTIKTITGVTRTEALASTKEDKTWFVREQIKKLATKKIGYCGELVKLKALLTRAAEATDRRNQLLHGLWGQAIDGGDVFFPNGLSAGQAPTVGELEALIDSMYNIITELNFARLKGFLHEALEARKLLNPSKAGSTAS